MDYGIAVKNKFELAFLDEDEDPLEILRLQEEEILKKKNEKPTGKGKDAKSAKDSKTSKNKKNKALTTVQDQKPKSAEPKEIKRDDKPPRNQTRQQNDRPNRPPREQNRDRDLPPRQRRDDQKPREGGFGAPATSPQSQDQYNRDRPESGRGRGRGEGRGGRGAGRGGPRGRGGPGGFDRFGKREFDRHSGSERTGIKPTEKREGGGAHNWGNAKDDVDDQLNNTNTSEENQDWAAQSEDVENQQPAGDAAPVDGEEAPAEEDNTAAEMTLDEWKAMQDKPGTSFNLRRAGEGCDNAQWKKTYVLSKKKLEDSDEEEDDEEYEDDHRKKNVVPIEITFYDQARRGGGREGGRGRGRGEGRGMGRGRGRGGDREGGDREDRRDDRREGGDRGGRGGFGRGRGGGEFRGGRGGGGGRGGDRGGRGGRGGGPREQAPNVEDELDFPSLGKPAL